MSFTPKTITHKSDLIFPYLYAFFLVTMSLCQLFSFDDFLSIFSSFNLFFGLFYKLIAALVVTIQVLSLPYLLSLDLAPWFRIFSMVCGLLAPVTWILLSLCLMIMNFGGDIGMFGGLISISPAEGLVLSLIVIALALICVSKFKVKK